MKVEKGYELITARSVGALCALVNIIFLYLSKDALMGLRAFTQSETITIIVGFIVYGIMAIFPLLMAKKVEREIEK